MESLLNSNILLGFVFLIISIILSFATMILTGSWFVGGYDELKKAYLENIPLLIIPFHLYIFSIIHLYDYHSFNIQWSKIIEKPFGSY